MKKGIWGLLLSVAVLAVIVMFCGAGGEGGSHVGDKTGLFREIFHREKESGKPYKIGKGQGLQETKSLSETTMTLVSFEESAYLQKLVEEYHTVHPERHIEIIQYRRSEDPQEDGVLKLQREIAAGGGPDLINFGIGYSTSDIVGQYTEDLYSYLDPGSYFENILTSFSYQQNLYAVPLGFSLQSFVGAKEYLGDRRSWTIEEMMACYQAQKGGKILYPGEFKKDVFGTILTGSMEYYIDWETGQCAFDGQGFKEVMTFCNTFPDQLDFSEEWSVRQMYLEDRALLLPISLSGFYDICRAECIFGDREVTFIGFPVDRDLSSGTVIKPWGPVLAVSRNSRNKEAAADFVRWCLSEECQTTLPQGFPVNQDAFEKGLANAMRMEYDAQAEGETEPSPRVKAQVIFEGESPTDIYCITDKQAAQLRELVRTAQCNSAVDRKLYNIFLEEIPYYFQGDKSLEDTAKVIQARVSMYVNERR